MAALTPDEEIDLLVDAGLLTERQAAAYVMREVELVPREAVAVSMGIAVSTLDDYRADAIRKVEAAEATVEAVREIRYQLDGQPSQNTP